jgi:hypothetical protein
MFTQFYNGSIRRMVVAFGSLFNDLYIDKAESGGMKRLLVPISYAPKEKYQVRLAGDPNLQNPNQIVLPRMAFEITGYAYDALRKRNSVSKVLYRPPVGSTGSTNVQYSYAEVPYNIDFSLYVYVRNMEDGLQIVEQILPHFTPEFVVTVNFDDLHKKFDIPITLTGFSSQEDYEGDFQSRRSIVFTLNFSMKTYLFGPKKVYKEIRIAESNLWNKDIWDRTGVGGITYTAGNTTDYSTYGKTIVGVSGPSAGITTYQPYYKVYENLTEGGSTYEAQMASGGVTVDWNI